MLLRSNDIVSNLESTKFQTTRKMSLQFLWLPTPKRGQSQSLTQVAVWHAKRWSIIWALSQGVAVSNSSRICKPVSKKMKILHLLITLLANSVSASIQLLSCQITLPSSVGRMEIKMVSDGSVMAAALMKSQMLTTWTSNAAQKLFLSYYPNHASSVKTHWLKKSLKSFHNSSAIP